MQPIDTFFEKYEWSYERVEENVWRSSFSTEREDDFDVYVMGGDDYIYFAVSPFLSGVKPACKLRLFAALLELSQQMRLVYFGVDDDGDVNLLAELPADGFRFEQFATVLDAMTHYTGTLARELARLATDPNYRGSLTTGP